MRGFRALPPPLPSEVFAKVLRLATADGRMLLVAAGLFAVLSAITKDGIGAVAGCLAAGAGALELHGANRLRLGDADGVRWLINSQLGLLIVVLIYVAARLGNFDPELAQSILTPERTEEFRQAGIRDEDMMPMMEAAYRLTYLILAAITIMYQGGMAWYYARRVEAVRTAVETIEPAPEFD